MIDSMTEAIHPDAGNEGRPVSLFELRRAFRKLGRKIVKCRCKCGDYRTSPAKGKQTRFIPGHHNRVRTAATRRRLSQSVKRNWSRNPQRREEYRERLSGEGSPMFGRYGAEAPNWSGGRITTNAGYVLRTIAPDHPYVAMAFFHNGSRHVLEHRLVAAETLGRPLADTDVIHHRSGDKQDNRPENLLVFASQAEHGRLHALLSAGVSEGEAIAKIVLDRYPALTAALV